MSLSDDALSILVFAAYHQLLSGNVVSEVVLDDGQGHMGSHKGAEELKQAGLLEHDGNRGKLTEAGETRLKSLVYTIQATR